MQLRTLAGLERKKIEDELVELLKLIAGLGIYLGRREKDTKIIKDELTSTKKTIR